MIAFEPPSTPGRAISMLEMFQNSQKLRPIVAAKRVRFLLDIPFCGGCLEYQRIAMVVEEDLVTVCSEPAHFMSNQHEEFRSLLEVQKREAVAPRSLVTGKYLTGL
jgi:hypothetical protein